MSVIRLVEAEALERTFLGVAARAAMGRPDTPFTDGDLRVGIADAAPSNRAWNSGDTFLPPPAVAYRAGDLYMIFHLSPLRGDNHTTAPRIAASSARRLTTARLSRSVPPPLCVSPAPAEPELEREPEPAVAPLAAGPLRPGRAVEVAPERTMREAP